MAVLPVTIATCYSHEPSVSEGPAVYVACLSLFLMCCMNAYLCVHFVYYTCGSITCIAHPCTWTHCVYCACMHVCPSVHCSFLCMSIVYCAPMYMCIHLFTVYIINVCLCVGVCPLSVLCMRVSLLHVFTYIDRCVPCILGCICMCMHICTCASATGQH